jgi:hypothetical protein
VLGCHSKRYDFAAVLEMVLNIDSGVYAFSYYKFLGVANLCLVTHSGLTPGITRRAFDCVSGKFTMTFSLIRGRAQDVVRRRVELSRIIFVLSNPKRGTSNRQNIL